MKTVCEYASQTESCLWYCVSKWNYFLASFSKLKPPLIMPLSGCELNAALDEVKTTSSSLVPIYRNTWLHMSVFVVLLFLPRNVLLVLIRLDDLATRCKIWSLKSLRCRTRGQWEHIIRVSVSAVTTNTLDNAHHNTGAMNQPLWQTTGSGVGGWNYSTESIAPTV
jgi:hypothetical protein